MRRFASTVAFGLVALMGAASATAGDEAAFDRHVLDRLAFGPSPHDLAAIEREGADRWIDEQLHPERLPEPAALTERLGELETLRLDPVGLFAQYGPHRGQDQDEKKAARRTARIVIEQASEAKLLREIADSHQLEAVLTDFWYNHFNVFANKGMDRLWAGDFAERAIRPHVFGRFRDLLEATARHPAMLFYLDNWQNRAPGRAAPNGKDKGLNENYARELMELHTLGVDGGYTQDDVVSLARILTGWGIGGPRKGAEGGFLFDPARHNDGDKRFLGRTIHGGGPEEVEQALDMLAASPATAHHLSYQLAQYFVADDPPKPLVDRLAARWRDTDGDLRAVLTLLFASPEFRDPANRGAKFKTPEQFVVSAMRASGAPVRWLRPLDAELVRQGEPVYMCQTPDGYANTRAAWLSPDSLTQRAGFALALGGAKLPLDQTPPAPDAEPAVVRVAAAAAPAWSPPDPQALLALLGPAVGPATRAAIASAPANAQAGLVLGSPDFMKR